MKILPQLNANKRKCHDLICVYSRSVAAKKEFLMEEPSPRRAGKRSASRQKPSSGLRPSLILPALQAPNGIGVDEEEALELWLFPFINGSR